jgi:hypothetical protein
MTRRPLLKKTQKGFPTAWSSEIGHWWSFFGGLNKEKALLQVGCFDCLVEEKAEQERKEEQRRSIGVGSWCGAMAVGVMLGMALMGFVGVSGLY